MSSDFDRDQLLDIFVAEAGDDMKRFWKALHPEGKAHPEPGEVAEFHAVGHKLKGAALLYGFAGLGQLGALLEETLEQVQEISADRWPAVLQLIRDIVASFRSQVEQIGRGGGEDPSVVENFVRRCGELVPAGSAEASDDSGESLGKPTEDYLIPVSTTKFSVTFPRKPKNISIPFKRFCSVWKSTRRIPRRFTNSIGSLHTLKGSAYTVGFQVVGDIARPIETCMIAVREGHAVPIAPTLDHRDPACCSGDPFPYGARCSIGASPTAGGCLA